jgi:DNA-binding MarR family transcriptional regulator
MDKCESKYSGCLYYSTNALGRIMTKIADEEFSKVGLTSSYALILMSIIEKPGIQPKEISQQMQLSPSTVSRLIEKLEYRRLLERKQNGRSIEIYPTNESKALYEKINDCQKSLYKRYTDILGIQNAKELTANIYEAVQKLN